MKSEKVKIINSNGLHLRPAGTLCREALKFEAKIEIVFNNIRANAKSVLSVLGACIKQGDEVLVEVNGKDEDEALISIIELLKKENLE